MTTIRVCAYQCVSTPSETRRGDGSPCYRGTQPAAPGAPGGVDVPRRPLVNGDLDRPGRAHSRTFSGARLSPGHEVNVAKIERSAGTRRGEVDQRTIRIERHAAVGDRSIRQIDPRHCAAGRQRHNPVSKSTRRRARPNVVARRYRTAVPSLYDDNVSLRGVIGEVAPDAGPVFEHDRKRTAALNTTHAVNEVRDIPVRPANRLDCARGRGFADRFDEQAEIQ